MYPGIYSVHAPLRPPTSHTWCEYTFTHAAGKYTVHGTVEREYVGIVEWIFQLHEMRIFGGLGIELTPSVPHNPPVIHALVILFCLCFTFFIFAVGRTQSYTFSRLTHWSFRRLAASRISVRTYKYGRWIFFALEQETVLSHSSRLAGWKSFRCVYSSSTRIVQACIYLQINSFRRLQHVRASTQIHKTTCSFGHKNSREISLPLWLKTIWKLARSVIVTNTRRERERGNERKKWVSADGEHVDVSQPNCASSRRSLVFLDIVFDLFHFVFWSFAAFFLPSRPFSLVINF